MATPPLRPLIGRSLQFGRAVLGWTALIIGAYFLAGWIGALVPRNGDWQPATGPGRTIEIMVQTNGAHTSIVMPRVSPEKDWTRQFPTGDVADPARPYTHLGISWGEREVFIDTPTWADLSPWTVLKVIFVGGDSLLHVEHYVRPAPSETLRAVRVTPAEYRRIVARIEEAIPPAAPTGTRRTYRGYLDHDVFYDARGTYTPIRTCNQWTSDVLADAGLRAGAWTPFAPGVMRWFEPPPQPPVRGLRVRGVVPVAGG